MRVVTLEDVRASPWTLEKATAFNAMGPDLLFNRAIFDSVGPLASVWRQRDERTTVQTVDQGL
ncbi:hypothetical protein D3877_17125 [Azospirillum cavernae]|uniref:Uncharacterized protein n=1 Tax=Azospirillum cavernae TaxID=2320860 RepID=A0A418VXD7_9PROT|nr:hypothetical protein [Azospirillum cavernae]RJF81827.1 hypothetical protein D3877_17125 [Azospirillum cavernae]